MPRFVLLKPLPISVAFRSCWFCLVLEPRQMPRVWTFCMQENGSPYAYYWMADYGTEQKAIAALYQNGFHVPGATVLETVLRRLVREGAAVELKSATRSATN